jgi:hypothetical protein
MNYVDCNNNFSIARAYDKYCEIERERLDNVKQEICPECSAEWDNRHNRCVAPDCILGAQGYQ